MESSFSPREIVSELDKFIIGHYGLLNHLRNPKNLWKILNILCEENTEFNDKLEIHLSGNIDEKFRHAITKLSNLHFASNYKRFRPQSRLEETVISSTTRRAALPFRS